MSISITHEGSLIKYGYHVSKSDLARHRALNKAIRSLGYGVVMKKINAVAVLNKHNAKGKIYESDKNYIKEKWN